MTKLEQLIEELCPDGVEYKTIEEVSDVFAGGDVPRERFSKEKTEKFNIPIYSNGTGLNALYGWTDSARITVPCVTIAARGTIGYTELRQEPFFPIIRLICVIPKKRVSVNYLKHAIKTIQFNVPLSGIPQLTIPMVSKYKIPLPPLPVQEEIVRILDKFTLLEAELTARQKQYEYYRDELLEFDDEVEYKALGEISTNMYRGSGIRRNQVLDSGTPCVRYGEIYTTYNIWFETCVSHTDEKTIPNKKYFEHGDILFAITGEKVEEIAKSCVYVGDEKCLAGGDMVVMKHNQNPKYLSYTLSTFDAQKQKSKGKVKSKVVHSSIPALKKIEIPLPPLEEQARIVAILDRFDALVNDISVGLPAEIEARHKQYEYYRDKLLTFKEKEV